MSSYTRREFLGTSSAALAGASLSAPASRAASTNDSVPPSDRLRFGAIGINGMGWANTNALLGVDGVECTALCDVDRNVLEKRASELEEQTGTTADLYEDYRRMLEDDTLDFVVIGTPDHWHCLPTVHACQAGKDVYVEKPLANTIGECHLMAQAAEKHGATVQVGQWQRSGDHWAAAVDYLQSGKLGRVRHVKAWIYGGGGRLEPKPNEASPPEGVNYDLWLGPAPERPFNPNRFHWSFRWYWDYAGGLMTDWGVHLLDYALIGMSVEYPEAVTGMGGKLGYPDGARETPDMMKALYHFDDVTVEWQHTHGLHAGRLYDRGHGVAFLGNNGTLVVDRGGWEVLPEAEDEQYKLDAIPPRDGEGSLDAHAENFAAAIREGEPLNCPIDAAARTAVVAHLGNVAYKTGRTLQWDPNEQQFDGDEEADEYVWPSYRDPWSLPKV